MRWEGAIMKCSFLTGRYMYSCTVHQKEVYVPSQFEIEEYCTSKRHTMCPFCIKVDARWEPNRNAGESRPTVEGTGTLPLTQPKEKRSPV